MSGFRTDSVYFPRLGDTVIIMGELYGIIPDRFSEMVYNHASTHLKISHSSARKKWASHFNDRRKDTKALALVSFPTDSL